MAETAEALEALAEVMRDCGWHGRASVCASAAREVERLRKERDAYQRGIGEICAAIPLPDVIRATATVGDLIAYLKENLPDKTAARDEAYRAGFEEASRQAQAACANIHLREALNA